MTAHALPDSVNAFLEREHRLLIGGEWIPGGETPIPVVNPATGASFSSIASAAPADIDAAVSAARAAFDSPGWRNQKPQERARMIGRIADLLEHHAEELAYLETLDNGKPFSISRAVDVNAAAGAFRYYAGWADKIHGQTHNISMPGDFHAYTLREPVGVAALVIPWNYPLVMAAMKLGPAQPAATMAVLFNSGQTCTATTRLYAHEDIYEQVMAGVSEVAKNVKVGPGFDEDSVLGPLVSARQLARVQSYIETGRQEGDEIVCGGEQLGEDGYFFQPTVVSAKSAASTLIREEIFGPVITAQRFGDIDEVIALANASSYGLSSSVWTQNLSHAHKLARSLVTGQVAVNTGAVADWDLPIGGYKQSGWGRENGFDAVANYLQTKAVAISL